MQKVIVTKEKLCDLFEEIAKLIEKKNHDYGDAWQSFGIFTPLIRINDKLLRLENLRDKRAVVADENIEDTLQDIVGYAMLALLWLKEFSEHPEKSSQPFDYVQLSFEDLKDVS